MEPIGVLAPATTANLGPGFDCLGMALDLWNRIDVTSGDGSGPVVEISGGGAGVMKNGDDNLVQRASAFLLNEGDREMDAGWER